MKIHIHATGKHLLLAATMISGISIGGRLSAQDLIPSPFSSSMNSVRNSIEREYSTICFNPSLIAGNYRQTLKLPNAESDSSACFVRLESSFGRYSGNFLPGNGNSIKEISFTAGGYLHRNRYGSFSGNISYDRSGERNTSWTSLRDFNVYAPYIAADSSGGDYHSEGYRFWTAWGYDKGLLQPTVRSAFSAEEAYRLTDPRTKNTTTYLQPGITLAYVPTSLPYDIALSLDYLYGRQAVHQWNWRAGQQVKFFVTYGFGMCDAAGSPIWFGYSRMHYINGLRSSVDLLPKGKKSPFAANLLFQSYHMEAEESNGVSLFASQNYQASFNCSYTKETWELTVSTDVFHRKGKEYIYEDYRPDEDYLSIYDLRLIDVRSRYRFTSAAGRLSARYILPLTSRVPGKNDLSFATGFRVFTEDEIYRGSNNKIARTTLTPYAGIGYTHACRTRSFDFNVLAAYRVVILPHYSVIRTQVEQLDFQLTYLPFLFETQEGLSLRLSSAIKLPISRGDIQIALQTYGRLRRNSAEIPFYVDKVGVNGSRMSRPEDASRKGRDIWAKLSLTYSF